MPKTVLQCLLVLGAAFLSVTVSAQDVTGSYRLDVFQSPGADDCVWRGTLKLTQVGGNPGTFTGSGALSVVSGPCLDFSGVSTGNIAGNVLDFGLGVGVLGSVDFDGVVAPDGTLSGTWTGLSLMGTWRAVPSTAVPTVSPGLLALLPFLMALGVYGLQRRRTVRS